MSLEFMLKNADYEFLRETDESIVFFDNLYIKYFRNDEIRTKTKDILNTLIKERAALIEKLTRKDNTPSGDIRWHLEGHNIKGERPRDTD